MLEEYKLSPALNEMLPNKEVGGLREMIQAEYGRPFHPGLFYLIGSWVAQGSSLTHRFKEEEKLRLESMAAHKEPSDKQEDETNEGWLAKWIVETQTEAVDSCIEGIAADEELFKEACLLALFVGDSGFFRQVHEIVEILKSNRSERDYIIPNKRWLVLFVARGLGGFWTDGLKEEVSAQEISAQEILDYILRDMGNPGGLFDENDWSGERKYIRLTLEKAGEN